MLPTHEVRCPHCGEALYSSLSLDDAALIGTPETPPVQCIDGHFFLQCPGCGVRVQMERFSARGREAYRLSGVEGQINAQIHDSRP